MEASANLEALLAQHHHASGGSGPGASGTASGTAAPHRGGAMIGAGSGGGGGTGDEYEVFVMKQDFKFHCAHFVAFKGYRERLHGHNYTVGVRMQGVRRGHDGYLIDFGDIKKVTRGICKELNEHLLVPTRSDVMRIDVRDHEVEMTCEDGARFLLPRGDCAMLPIVHSTAEELAQYLWHRITTTFSLDRLLARGIHTLQIIVAEAPQQEGSYTRRLTAGPLTLEDLAASADAAAAPQPCLGQSES